MSFGWPNFGFLGYPIAVPRPEHGGLGFRQARRADAAAIAEHYRHLSPLDRNLRFCGGVSDSAMEAHVARIWDTADIVIAGFDGPLWPGPFHKAGLVRALAEVSIEGQEAEIGLSVHEEFRRRGLGRQMVQMAARLLAPRGVETLKAYTLPRNRAMLGLGRDSGGTVTIAEDDAEIAFSVKGLIAALRERQADKAVSSAPSVFAGNS